MTRRELIALLKEGGELALRLPRKLDSVEGAALFAWSARASRAFAPPEHTLESLRAAQKELTAELAELSQEEAKHPAYRDEVLKPFLAHARELADKVVYLEPLRGVTESRKNMMHFRGWRFRLREDTSTYEITWGSNWCHDFCTLERDGKEQDLKPQDYIDVIEGDEDMVVANVQGLPPAWAVACLLRRLEW